MTRQVTRASQRTKNLALASFLVVAGLVFAFNRIHRLEGGAAPGITGFYYLIYVGITVFAVFAGILCAYLGFRWLSSLLKNPESPDVESGDAS
jgi:hypothetical protein